MAHLALGTDTGGSIRMPAAYCGITGLKPTYGLLSRYGIFPNTWDLDHSGPFGRTAEDTALLLGVLAGHDPRDPTSTSRPVPDYRAELRGDVRGLRAGLLSQQLALAELPVREAVLESARTLEAMGVSVQDVTLPHEEAAVQASTVILYAALSSGHLTWLRSRPQDYGANLREALLPGVLFPAAAYVKAQRIRTLVLREARAALERVDVLITATTPYPAPAIGATPALSAVRFTRLGNLLGYPAASTPCGWSARGLPLGLQIIGRPWEDGLVLRVVHAYQQASGLPDFSRHRPPAATG
jgi:aspartyl-tRNA(Asn)/glutamyl-tRNA(Gln) amidotransferase subunit A